MAIRLNLTTDYAVRILTELNIRQEISAAVELAEALRMSYEYFSKVVTKLKKAGFIRSVQGCNGGYELGKKAEDISVYDVIVEMEGEIRLNRCLEVEGYCNRDATSNFAVHTYLGEVQDALIEKLREKRISDFGLKKTKI